MYKSEIFIEKSKLKHGDKYDYTNVSYIDNLTKVEIICKYHGSFFQKPRDHLNRCGCPICGVNSMKMKKSNTEWKKDFIRVHGDLYDYSKVIYINAKLKIEIVCKKHGSFYQRVMEHKNGHGCPSCGKLKAIPKISENWIDKFKEKHGDLYDYSEFNYINGETKSKIICKDHGSFQQSGFSHISGNGCPKCKLSKGESRIMRFLKNNQFIFETGFVFENCRYKYCLPFDFYLPEKNICIEYDGIQHFESIDFFGGKKRLNEQKLKDEIKNSYCLINNIKLIRIPYFEYEFIEKILQKNLLFF